MNLIQKKPRVKRGIKLQTHVSESTLHQVMQKVGDGSVSAYLRDLVRTDLAQNSASQALAA